MSVTADQMELREELSQVSNQSDPVRALNRLMEHITAAQQEMETRLRKLFADQDDKARQQARSIVQKMQFLQRLQQEAEEVEEQLLDAF